MAHTPVSPSESPLQAVLLTKVAELLAKEGVPSSARPYIETDANGRRILDISMPHDFGGQNSSLTDKIKKIYEKIAVPATERGLKIVLSAPVTGDKIRALTSRVDEVLRNPTQDRGGR